MAALIIVPPFVQGKIAVEGRSAPSESCARNPSDPVRSRQMIRGSSGPRGLPSPRGEEAVSPLVEDRVAVTGSPFPLTLYSTTRFPGHGGPGSFGVHHLGLVAWPTCGIPNRFR